jgi:hypothetical protein
MKKVLLIIFLTACLGRSAQAGMVTFDFDSLNPGTDDTGIGSYMTDLYGSTVTVTGATSYPYGNPSVDPLSALGNDQYIADAEQGNHQFYISFSVPITYVSFDWAREDDPFKVEATYAGGTVQVFSVGTGETNGGTGHGWEEIDLLDRLGSPVTSLYFHDGGQGGIGIDNLVVNAVPLPASILLGAFAVSLAGWKLRLFV